MAVLKLSQIAAAGGAPAATDQLVGVTGGATDNLFSLTQINTSVLNTIGAAVGSAKITGGSSGNFFFNSAGVLGEKTPTQATAALNLFTNTLQGLVSGSGGGTANFLRADDTWAVPPGTPGGANTNVQFNNSSAFGGDAGFTYGGQGTNPMVTIALGTITTNVKGLNITGTWNAGGVTFDAPLFMNITSTASATGSLLMDLQVGSSSVFNVDKTGYIGTFAGGTITGTQSQSGISNVWLFEDTGRYLASNAGGFVLISGTLGINSTGNQNTAPADGLFGFSSAAHPIAAVNADTAFFRDAAVGVVGLADKNSSTTATGLRVYNTTDNVGTNTAPTNYERFTHDWTTTANTATLGTQNGGTGSARAMNIITGGTNAITISTAQAVAFPGVGTTASAANAFLDNAASNNLLRSTSSLRYKTAVTGVPDERIQALVVLQPIEFQSRASSDNPNIRFVGYAAEEVARIDPALVSLDGEGRPDSVMYDRVLLLKIAALEQRLKNLEN